jgi:hypothetical protein
MFLRNVDIYVQVQKKSQSKWPLKYYFIYFYIRTIVYNKEVVLNPLGAAYHLNRFGTVERLLEIM